MQDPQDQTNPMTPITNPTSFTLPITSTGPLITPTMSTESEFSRKARQIRDCNMLKFQISQERQQQIESDMKLLVETMKQRISNQNSSEVSVEEVKGVSFSESKEGEPFSHWAVEVGRFYYHLVFNFYDKDGKLCDSPQGVEFESHKVRNIKKTANKKVMGHTRFTDEEIETIGDTLISKFGTYYQLFWNCQHFAHILIELLTGQTLKMEGDSTSWVAGAFFRIPIFGSSTHWSIKAVMELRKEHVRKQFPPEFLDIIQFLAYESGPDKINIDVPSEQPTPITNSAAAASNAQSWCIVS